MIFLYVYKKISLGITSGPSFDIVLQITSIKISISGNFKPPILMLSSYFVSAIRNNLHFVKSDKKISTSKSTKRKSNPNKQKHPEKPRDRFMKVRALFDAIRNRCLQLTIPADLCIDESMIPFKGKINVLQYIKGKPHPWGIKVFI